MVSRTYDAFAQLPGHPRVRVEDSTLVYVMPTVHESGTPDEYGCTVVEDQVTSNPV
jgi:hypothetical protein